MKWPTERAPVKPPAHGRKWKEASANRIGSPVDQVLLFCFHYDAMTGKYSANATAAVRAGGVLTLLALGTFMIFARRRTKK